MVELSFKILMIPDRVSHDPFRLFSSSNLSLGRWATPRPNEMIYCVACSSSSKTQTDILVYVEIAQQFFTSLFNTNVPAKKFKVRVRRENVACYLFNEIIGCQLFAEISKSSTTNNTTVTTQSLEVGFLLHRLHSCKF